MAQPSVFVSSTYVDLRHVREHVASFIEQLGYTPRLFEKGGIGFDFQKPIDESCYEAVSECDIFVLIVGGRYGSSATSDIGRGIRKYNSITRREYMEARSLRIPIYIYVDKDVLAEFKTYTKNKKNKSIEYAFVDNILVFNLIDDIYRQQLNNFITPFSNMEDITESLKNQWAAMMKSHIKRRSQAISRNIVRVNSLKMFYFRRLRGFSQSGLAKEIGINRRQISFLEQLKVTNKREFDGYHQRYFPECEFSIIARIEKALDCPGKLRAGLYDDFLSMYVEYYANNHGSGISSKKNRHPMLGFETKVVVFDFDGTITKSDDGKSTWEMMWEHLGYSVNECAMYHTQFRRNEITHQEWCDITLDKFRQKNFSKQVLKEICRKIHVMPGFDELVDELYADSKKLYILSGSVEEIIRNVIGDKNIALFREIKANEMEFSSDGRLSKIVGTKYDFTGKADFLRHVVDECRCSPMDVLYVGNAGNDRWASNSGARTLCVNPTSTDPDNPKEWTFNIRKMDDMRQVAPYII